jgi:hypothetical protein
MRLLWTLAIAAFAASGLFAQTPSEHSVSAYGWKLTADDRTGQLRIDHDRIGPVITAIQLFVGENDPSKVPLRNWTSRIESSSRLTVQSDNPQSFWRFELEDGAVVISSTSDHTVLTGSTSAPPTRQVARLMDPGGVPVDWTGTDEVHDGYGGAITKRRSYLPRRNNDIMYFALGSVSAGTLHSLFDRPTDTAIDFPEQTSFLRNSDDSKLLDTTISFAGNAVLRIIADYYTKTLGLPYYVPFDDSHFPRPPVVWSSWTSYYADVTEADIVRNTDWLAEKLKPYGFEYVQLDDGYDRDPKGQHYWIENWNHDRFPHGPEWLAHYIKSKGLRAGIWLVPNAYAGAVKQHPEWYLRDVHGNLILDYSTPALDSSNPEVLEFLKKLFTTLDGWGFDYYKFDGEHAVPLYVPKVDRSRLKDGTTDPLEIYRRRLSLIRDVIGPDRYIEGCPAGTPLNGIGYFQSYFNGDDLYNTWQGMYPLFSSINANGFLNHEVVYLMPGEGVEMRPPMSLEDVKATRHPSVLETARDREEPLTQFGTTAAEARTLVTYLSLTGVVYPLASVMTELPEERVELLKETLPPLPIVPLDLFSRGTDMLYDRFKYTTADTYIHNYPEVLDLKVSAASGTYDVVGVTNWRSGSHTRRISFQDELGLAPRRYAVFDFWNRKFLGVFDKAIDIEVAPHDTAVLTIRPAEDHPQLLGTARHISGSFSIESLKWVDSANRLEGQSTTIPGTPYTLWVHVPQNFKVSSAKASANDRTLTGVELNQTGELLRLTLPGQQDAVNWQIQFSPASKH